MRTRQSPYPGTGCVLLMTGGALLLGAWANGAATPGSFEADALSRRHRTFYERREVVPALGLAEREIVLRRAGKDPRGLAGALRSYGVYLADAGRHDRAIPALEEALALGRSPEVGDSLFTARVLLDLAASRAGRRLQDASNAAAAEAYRIRRDVFGEEAPETAECLYWIRRGDLAGLREVLRVQREHLGPDHEHIARTMQAMGELLGRQGDHEQSERILRDALGMLRRLAPPGDPRLVDGLFQLAFTLRGVGEVQEAIDVLGEGLAILEARFEVHPMAISCRNGIAVMLNDLLRHEEAAQLMRRNEEDCRILYPDDAVQSVFVTVNLAHTLGLVRRFEAADSLLDVAACRGGALERRGYDILNLHHTVGAFRGRIANWRGRHAEAESLFTESCARIQITLPEAHEQTVKAWLYLADARAGRGDHAGAESSIDRAVSAYEGARLRIGSGIRPVAFQKTPYESRAICRIALGRFEEAWQDVDRSRGRLLVDSLRADAFPFPLGRVRRALRPDEAIVGWVDHEFPERTPLSYAYVIRSTGPVTWVPLPGDPGERVFARTRRYARFRDSLVEEGLSAFSGPGEIPREEAHRLWQDRIEPLVVHLDGIRTLVVIPSGASSVLPLEVLIDDSGRFLGERWNLRQAPSASVYAWLVERGRGDRGAPRSGLFVGDPPYREEHLAAAPLAGDPPRRPSDSPIPPAILRSAVRSDPEALQSLPRLPWSRREVEAIAALFPEPTVLLGAEASSRTLSDLAASDRLAAYDILHFATHALVDDIQPGRSALVLAQVSGPRPGGGEPGSLIKAEDIGRWRLDADLVTLSACETANGREVFGEGTVGFAYPLLRAGARCLLVSRWPVNDEATALLLSRFYAVWLGAAGSAGEEFPDSRMTKSEALREAKAWLREWRDPAGSRPYAHPYYWASFMLLGID